MTYSLFQEITDFDHLCQGDILQASAEENEKFGILITADCDLAQDKTHGELNMLEMVTAESFFRDIWPAREHKHLADEILKNSLAKIKEHKSIKSVQNLKLNEETLCDWIRSDGHEKICEDLGKSRQTNQLLPFLKSLEKVLCNPTPSKTQIFDLWNELNKSDGYKKDRINRAIDPSKGQADVFFLPYLPQHAEIGYVTLLRRIRQVDESNVFRNRQEKLRSSSGPGYFRIARLTDNLRFSLVQKMSVLFSRIGHEVDFETELREASNITINTMIAEGRVS